MTEQLMEEGNKISNPVLSGNGEATNQVKVDVHNPSAVPRPHAPAHLVSRASMRITNKKKLQAEGGGTTEMHSPFKRGLSLQLNKLPSNISRLQNHTIMNPVPEVEDEEAAEGVGFTRSFRTNNNDDPFSKAPMQQKLAPAPVTNTVVQPPAPTIAPIVVQQQPIISNQLPLHLNSIALTQQQPLATTVEPPQQQQPPLNLLDMTSSPIRDTNPWAADTRTTTTNHVRTASEADRWLSDLERQVSQPQASVFAPQAFQAPPQNNMTSQSAWGVRPPEFQVSM